MECDIQQVRLQRYGWLWTLSIINKEIGKGDAITL